MFRRILVPVDGSTFSEHALPYAARIAAKVGAKLEIALVHISYRPVTADISLRDAINSWEREHRRNEADYLHALAARITAEAGYAVEPIMLAGDVVPALEHEIKHRGVDLVVMTTHGRAGFERAWLGSVADSLVRHVDAPVLLIRPSDREPDSMADAAPLFTHILLALDGSERAERTLSPAFALAFADRARITVLRSVAPPFAITSPFMPHALQLTRNQIENRMQSARAYIDQKVQELQQRGIDTVGHTVAEYHPAHAILRHAAAAGADLIALGTHGRGPITRFMLGSVSDKVVRAAEVPVLVC